MLDCHECVRTHGVKKKAGLLFLVIYQRLELFSGWGLILLILKQTALSLTRVNECSSGVKRHSNKK